MKFLEEIFLRSWWVILFTILCYLFFEQGLKHRDTEYRALYTQLLLMREVKDNALLVQKDLMMQINSQSDIAWIELTLMKGLGMVPEGQTKVYFNPKLKP